MAEVRGDGDGTRFTVYGARLQGERCTTYDARGTSHVTFWGCGSSNTGDTQRAISGERVAGSRQSMCSGQAPPGHSFPMEWMNLGLPPGLQSNKEKAKVEVKV